MPTLTAVPPRAGGRSAAPGNECRTDGRPAACKRRGGPPENVVSVAREEDGWHVGVEVVELHRIPDTTDVMAVYQVTLDGGGELVRCERGRRYHRGSTEGEW